MRIPALVGGMALWACTPEPKGTSLDTGALQVDGDQDGYTGADDCDDADPAASPGGVEVCDGVDNDCDGEADNGVTSTFYIDIDGDGFGDPEIAAAACAAPSGYVEIAGDCDDRDADSHPEAPERCDNADNDCDLEIDEEVLFTWYADADDDGAGDPESAYTVCDPPEGYVENADDCDDTDEVALPGGVEVCDEADNDCDGSVDEDVTTTYYQDMDGDNYGLSDVTTEACSVPTGYAATPGDCDDAEPRNSPIGIELCDEADNDCDGIVDEDDAADAATWYADNDGDRYANTAVSARACTAPSGYLAVSPGDDLDCDDADASIYPGATEYCDGVDEDCNTTPDDDAADASIFYADGDGDGYGGSVSVTACGPPGGFVSTGGDCDDAEKDIYPGAKEHCDGEDEDCDGTVDEDVPSTEASSWYADADGDGYGDRDSSTRSCSAPSGYVEDNTDCDDASDTTFPSAEERCDGSDNNCDNAVDEGLLGTDYDCPASHCAQILDDQPGAGDGDYYLDWDRDGYPSLYTCDMTTDGGGWTQVVTWNAEDDGDGWDALGDEMDLVYDNMTSKLASSAASYIYWADDDSTADVLAYERPVSMPNTGEILLDVHYAGYSMDNSAIFFYAETSSSAENLLCKEDDDGGYSSTEYAYWPYSCADSADTSWDWDGTWQDAFSDEITAFHLRSFHYDGTGGDYSYLYRLNVYVR